MRVRACSCVCVVRAGAAVRLLVCVHRVRAHCGSLFQGSNLAARSILALSALASPPRRPAFSRALGARHAAAQPQCLRPGTASRNAPEERGDVEEDELDHVASSAHRFGITGQGQR